MGTIGRANGAVPFDTYDKTDIDSKDALKLNASNYTALDVLNKIKTIDGAGSGLDADKLDGLDGTQFLRSDVDDLMSANLHIGDGVTGNSVYVRAVTGSNAHYWLKRADGTSAGLTYFDSASEYVMLRKYNTAGSTVTNQIRLSDTNIDINGNTIWHAGNDGVGSGLNADNLDGVTWSNVNTTISSTGVIESGRGSGGVAMTINDGYGNANVTWNHASGVPEQNGNAARITVNTDSTTGAHIAFQVKSGVTGGTATALTSSLILHETYATLYGNTVWHAGNDGFGSGLDADKLRGLPADFTSSKATNGYQKLPSGLIIQWRTIYANTGNNTVAFPIAFPNACFVVTGSPEDNNSGAEGNDVWRNLTTTNFVLENWTGVATNFRYMAIGY